MCAHVSATGLPATVTGASSLLSYPTNKAQRLGSNLITRRWKGGVICAWLSSRRGAGEIKLSAAGWPLMVGEMGESHGWREP